MLPNKIQNIAEASMFHRFVFILLQIIPNAQACGENRLIVIRG